MRLLFRSKRGGGRTTQQPENRQKGKSAGSNFFLFLTSIKYYMFNGKVDRLLAQFCYYIPRILRSLNPEKNRNHTHTQTETHVKYTILLTRNMLCYMKNLVGKIEEFCRILKNHQLQYINAVDIFFSSNHNIHKIWFGLCFWASYPLIDRYY